MQIYLHKISSWALFRQRDAGDGTHRSYDPVN